MGLFVRGKAWRADGRRIAEMHATRDHDWQVVNAHYGQALFRNITWECRKCGKVGSIPVGGDPR